MLSRLIVLLFLTTSWAGAQACAVVLSAGSNLHNAALTYAGKTICLNEGTYNLGSNSLNVSNGTTIEGLTSNRDNVVLYSTAVRAIVVGSSVSLKNFYLRGVPGSEFGILAAHTTDVTIWGLRLSTFGISIGVLAANSTNVWDTFMGNNGTTTNGRADPNMWITNSNGVSIQWGEVRGRANGPGGDGEIAGYDSTGVEINGTSVIDSGASAIYLVNCDYCKVTNATIHRAGEWGLDIVNGSDYFEASNNKVFWSGFGGSVFDEAGSNGGTYIGNTFQDNRRQRTGNCNGINVMGNISGVIQYNNVSNRAGIICNW